MVYKEPINQEVNITSLYFRNKYPLKSFPRRMEYNGREYNFNKSGLEYRIKKGASSWRLFDMSDGLAKYRLSFDDNQASWTLVSITRTVISGTS